jgi:hypothetical protein
MRKHNLKGKRFGKLVVVDESSERKYGNVVWDCICDCGNSAKYRSRVLLIGEAKSCGCLHKEQASINQGLMNLANKEIHTKEGVYLPSLRRKVQKRSKTGIKGVYWRKDGYVANITVKKTPIYLGFYKNKQDAIQARKEAEEKYFNPILKKENSF